MKRSAASPTFSFLSISPLPGMLRIKQESLGLCVLSLCETLSAALNLSAWPMLIWEIVALTLIFAACALAFRAGETHSGTTVTALRAVYRICVGLKSLSLCFIAYISVHKAFYDQKSMCLTLSSGLERCESPSHWWMPSLPALAIAGGLTVIAQGLLCVLLRQLQKVRQELRYRSLTHYLEL